MAPRHGRRSDSFSNMFILKILVNVMIVNYISATKLNVPRVLLPYSDDPPSFSLESESGCYSWTSTRPDIVDVQVDPNSVCKSSAVII